MTRNLVVAFLLLVLCVSARADVFVVSATPTVPVDESPDVRVNRLRVRHHGGGVTVLPATDGKFRVLVDGVEGNGKPSVVVTLTEVSPGNYILTTSGEREVAPGVQGNGVTFGAGVHLGDGARSIHVGDRPLRVDETTRLSARLTLYLPMKDIQHVSVTTTFGNILFNNLTFTEIKPTEKAKHVLHAATGEGGVTMNRVLYAQIFTASTDGNNASECRVQLGSGAWESYFR